MFFYQQGVCIMTTAFLHFFFLASFCWVLTEAWQSYMAVTGKVRTRLIRKRFLCLGWGKETIHFPKTFYLFFPFSVLELAFSHIVSVCLSKCLCEVFFFFSIRDSHRLCGVARSSSCQPLCCAAFVLQSSSLRAV